MSDHVKGDVLPDHRACAIADEVRARGPKDETEALALSFFDLTADRDRLRAEVEGLRESLGHAVVMAASAQADYERVGKEADQYRKGWLEKTAENERLKRAQGFVYVVTRDYVWGGKPTIEVVGVADSDAAGDVLIAEHREGLTPIDGRTRTYETVEYEVARSPRPSDEIGASDA